MGSERGQSTEESKKTSTQNTYVHKPGICIIPGTTTTTSNCCCEFKENTAPHDTAPKTEGKARHCTALRCAAELYIAVLN